MSDEYKQTILDHFNVVLSEAMNASPNYQTMLMIRDSLILRGMSRNLAESAVTSMQVVVDDALFADHDFMKQVVDSYAEVVYRIYKFAQDTFIADDAFMNLIEGMSLTLIPPQ